MLDEASNYDTLCEFIDRWEDLGTVPTFDKILLVNFDVSKIEEYKSLLMKLYNHDIAFTWLEADRNLFSYKKLESLKIPKWVLVHIHETINGMAYSRFYFSDNTRILAY